MKILIYNRHFYPSIGGTEASGRIMATELANLGHDVTVYTSTPSAIEELNEGYQIIRSQSLPKLFKLALLHNITLSRGGLSLRSLLASVMTHTPLVVFHEMAETLPNQSPTFGQKLRAHLKTNCLRLAALHVCVSDALQSTLSLPDGSRTYRLYNPISDALWTKTPPNFKDRHIDVAFIGRVQTSKGALVFGDALKHISRDRTLRVAIVGDGPAIPQLRQMLDLPRLNATFHGQLSGNDLRHIYAQTKIVAVPSLALEGMGMVAAEAMGSGTPVCISNDPALQEVTQDAGRIHPTKDAVHLAQDIMALLDNKTDWTNASTCALKRRAAFSLKTYKHALAHELCPELHQIAGK